MRYLVAVVVLSLLTLLVPALAEDGFTKRDRELLIELRVKMGEIDKRFEQIDKRLSELRQDMNERFDQMTDFLYILAGIFTSLVAVVIGFAYWDRRTIIREARIGRPLSLWKRRVYFVGCWMPLKSSLVRTID